MKDYSISTSFATTISRVLANATGSPECEAFCMGCIQNKQIPDPVMDHWYNGVHSTLPTTNMNFMLMAYEFVKSKTIFHYDGTENSPKTVDIADLSRLLKSGTENWDYDNEGTNDISPNAAMHSIESEISIAVQTLFTTVGFDKSVYMDSQDKFALMPHTAPTVNNRPVRMENVFQNCSIVDGKLDTEKSLWHYLTNKGKDGRKDNFLKNTRALTLIAKKMSRDEIPFDQSKKSKMAPFNDMWFEASSTALKNVDKSEEATILGDPVAVPATFNDVKEIFTLLTGKDFEKVFKVNSKDPNESEKIEQVNDDMKALLCLIEVSSLLTRPSHPKDNINFLQGRLKLFALLIRQHFGVEKLVGMIEHAKTLPQDKKVQQMNVVLPCTPGELHLRIMILFNASTKVTLLPLESQKRQVASLYNYLEQRPSKKSIISSHEYDETLRPERESINVEFDGSEEMWKKAEELAEAYFLRSGCFVGTELLGFKRKDLGLTKAQSDALKGTSTEQALEGGLVEPKAISDFFADSLRRIQNREDNYCMNVTKEFPPETLKKKTRKKDEVMIADNAGIYFGLFNGCEKKLKPQVMFMRRFFLMLLIEYNNSPSTKGQVNFVLEELRKYARVAGATEDTTKMIVNSHKEAQKVNRWKNFLTNIKDYQKRCLDGHCYVYEDPDCIYDADEMILSKEHFNSLDWNGNSSNPEKPEFWYTLYLLNSSYSIGTKTRWGHWFGTEMKPETGLKPLGLVILSNLFSHAVFSRLSLRNMIALFANNGSRALQYNDHIEWLVQSSNDPSRYPNIVSKLEHSFVI